MILTGDEIIKEIKKSNITITPFNKNQINPNSYNYRIGEEIVVFSKSRMKKEKIPKKGFVLKPHQIYLASTYEILGSKKYAMSLIGRSSLGRLGLFLQVSANLGHTGSKHSWTLELVSAKSLRIYPNMIIGQISFWDNYGNIIPYRKSYSKYNKPKQSKLRGLK
ncbi:MAG: deoxycytidine deaminase [Candidatus Nanoarchaeia archaeon]|nr:deoxycytidine deaminase [Candidatus Nanoarchaeia archaeon]